MVEILSWLLQQIVIGDWKVFVYSIIQAVFLIAIGIVAGKVVSYILHKLADKANLARVIKQSFTELFIAVIRWSIYILFIEIGLEQLNIPDLTNFLSLILIAIPAIVGSLILIGIGFIIASYLKDIIEESKVLNWEILSSLVFFFVLYVFSIFALKTALFSFDKIIVNIIIIILTAVIATAIALSLVFGRKKK